MADTLDRESRIQRIAQEILSSLTEEGPLRSASSLFSGRALQRRLLARALDDADFRTRLFRFVDVYPSLRDSGDLVRHLRAYLDDRGETPPPLDRLLASPSARRLPSWIIARYTDRVMQRMAKGLIAGRDASEALPSLRDLRRRHMGFTLGILGETCVSDDESSRYLQAYYELLDSLPPKIATWPDDPLVDTSPAGLEPRLNLSLKLTSVYSQADAMDFEGSRQTIVAKLKPLCLKARQVGAFLCIDLERFACHDLAYAVFADLVLDNDLRDYPHVGTVLQAYLRQSEHDLVRLVDLARRRNTPFTVRLVKGAYWDHETIVAAQEHWPVPVFTSKAETDAQFETLAARLVENWQWTRPALGTHNIRSMAAGLAAAEVAGLSADAVELQVLHGMADPIARAAVARGYRVREYVPVGEMITGMAYLVRRLLENTSNESFLSHTFVQHQDATQLLAPPMPTAKTTPGVDGASDSATPATAPAALLTPTGITTETIARFQNEPHADFSKPEMRAEMEKALATIRGSLGRDYHLVINGASVATSTTSPSVNPARPDEVVGWVAQATREHAAQALEAALAAFPAWRDTPARERAATLLKAAAIMREQRFELAALEIIEVGKPWREADADVTETIDFLEYYGREMLRLYRAQSISDVPGEDDFYLYEPRGVAAVIAPWNSPLAIPTGMTAAALVAGNTVVFKPAGPAAVTGYAMVRILHQAGIPGGALNFLPGPGNEVGDYLVADPRVDLIAFTGSLKVGLSIMQKAAVVAPGQRNIKKVITEMGGKNAIIIDTDADLDAAVQEVIVSAFHYAGQKCSACSRVIVLEEIHDQFVGRLTQAVASLKVGDPADPGTRLGPVITAETRDRILSYIHKGGTEATQAYPPADTDVLPAMVTPARAEVVAVPTTSTATPVETAAKTTPQLEPAAAATEAGDTIVTTTEAPASEQGVSAPGQGVSAPEAKTAVLDSSAAASASQSPVPTALAGYFVLPHVFTDVSPQAVIAQEEIFGPVLAVLKASKFSEALDMALGVGYGLTGGVYSRNPAHIRQAYNEFRVGNLYINRPITGAMVGRQPFGGSRMSGVGSKAGGPDYLLQFMEPRTITENTIRRGFAPAPEK